MLCVICYLGDMLSVDGDVVVVVVLSLFVSS